MTQDTLPMPSAPPARRPRWRVPMAILLVAGAAGGGWFATHSNNTVAAAKSEPEKPKMYELGASDIGMIAARELRLTLPLSGTLTPLTQALVKSKVSADVQTTLVQEGVSVVAGQVIARLESADLKARLATQQAALEEAQARLSLAQKNNRSNQALHKQNFISQNAVDTTQNSVDLAQANVKSAASQVEIARVAMSDMIIHAPISGVVSKRYIQTGEKASPDMPLFSIVNLRHLTLEAQVPTNEIPRIKIGQEVLFTVDGFVNRAFQGKVARINPATEAGSRSMLVYVAVENADEALKAGMFAKGGITVEKSASMPLVPIAALRQDKGADIVYVIENNIVVARPVKLGLRNEDEGLAEVSEGLRSGARVIVSRLDAVKPGSKVKSPEPAAPASATGKKD